MRLSQPFFILPSRLILSLGLDKYVLYSLRKTPTAIYPANSAPSGAVTLTHPVDIRRTSPINTPVLQDEEMALPSIGVGGKHRCFHLALGNYNANRKFYISHPNATSFLGLASRDILLFRPWATAYSIHARNHHPHPRARAF